MTDNQFIEYIIPVRNIHILVYEAAFSVIKQYKMNDFPISIATKFDHDKHYSCDLCKKRLSDKSIRRHYEKKHKIELKNVCWACISYFPKMSIGEFRKHLIQHRKQREIGKFDAKNSQNESHLPSSTCTDSEFTGHLMGTCKSINLKISQKDIKSFLWKTHKEFYDTFNINFCPRPECRRKTFLTFDDQFNHIYYKHLEAGQKFKNT